MDSVVAGTEPGEGKYLVGISHGQYDDCSVGDVRKRCASGTDILGGPGRFEEPAPYVSPAREDGQERRLDLARKDWQESHLHRGVTPTWCPTAWKEGACSM